ncbi:MAG: hypothetical protein GF332_04830 [Candidatus Moranbacteria bacterium]|nr:hypothetical protein [Candidatus Moranbacteria bacterium]
MKTLHLHNMVNKKSKKRTINRYLSMVSVGLILGIFTIVIFIFIGYQDKLSKNFIDSSSKKYIQTIQLINSFHQTKKGFLENDLSQQNQKNLLDRQLKSIDKIINHSRDQINFLNEKNKSEFEYQELTRELIEFYKKVQTNYEKEKQVIIYFNDLNEVTRQAYHQLFAQNNFDFDQIKQRYEQKKKQQEPSQTQNNLEAKKQAQSLNQKEYEAVSSITEEDFNKAYLSIIQSLEQRQPSSKLNVLHKNLIHLYNEKLQEANLKSAKLLVEDPAQFDVLKVYEYLQDQEREIMKNNIVIKNNVYIDLNKLSQELNQKAKQLKDKINLHRNNLQLSPIQIQIEEWGS